MIVWLVREDDSFLQLMLGRVNSPATIVVAIRGGTCMAAESVHKVEPQKTSFA